MTIRDDETLAHPSPGVTEGSSPGVDARSASGPGKEALGQEASPKAEVTGARAMAKEAQGTEKKSWLAGVTRTIAGVGAVVGALLAVLTQLEAIKAKLGNLFGAEDETVEVTEVTPSPPALPPPPPSRKDCLEVEFRHPQRLPLNLFHRIPDRDNHFPYWFKVEAENRCDEDLTIEIEFKRYKGPFMIKTGRSRFSDTLPPGSYSKRIDPPIVISNYDSREPMVINWYVRDDRDTVLDSGNSELEVLPRSTIAWDLENADEEPVSREYLLASLAAWTGTPDPELDAMAQSCRQAADGFESVFQLRDCYRRLFVEENPVFFSKSPLRFPDDGRQTVLSPPEVLEKRQASQLEAAILLAAVGRQLGPRFRLIGRSGAEGGGELKSFLLAMQTTPAADWQAVDLGRAAGSELEENLLAATEELDRLRQHQPQIFQGLENKGVYLDNHFVAIDFRRADHHFEIGRLPS